MRLPSTRFVAGTSRGRTERRKRYGPKWSPPPPRSAAPKRRSRRCSAAMALRSSRAREDLNAIAAEQRLDLRFGAADRGGGGDHFGPYRFLLSVRPRDVPATKRVDGSLI